MSQIFSTLKSSGRVALVAVMLGAASLGATATPVMAQPSFSFDFGIGGGGNGFSFRLNDRGVQVRRDCLTWNEVRRGLRRGGWQNIELVEQSRRRFEVEARSRRDNRMYSMTVDRCTGDVYDIRRLRQIGPGPRPRPGFGLQFNF